MKIRCLAWVLTIALLAGGCWGSAATTGKTGEWVKGKSLSINATFVSAGSMGPRLLLSVGNDSTSPLSILPIRATGWFDRAGKLDSEPEPGLLSATYAVTSAAGETRKLQIDSNASSLVLNPGESVHVGSTVHWNETKVRFDSLNRARLVPAAGGANEEIFTIE